MTEQLDIHGQAVDIAQPVVAAVPITVEQPRLFEPQMEGQLALGDDDA